ncbi:MAG: hypothetical protein L6R36_006408, partial [Xanthoria steineri]
MEVVPVSFPFHTRNNEKEEELYICLSGDFCLINNRCCPNGLPAETYAEHYGITLPEDFSTDAPSTLSTPGTISRASRVGPTTTPIVTTPVPLPSPIPDTAIYPLPSIIPGNATKPGGPAAPSGTGAFPRVSTFTGPATIVK